MESWILRVSCNVNVQETRSIHNSMNIPKIESISYLKSNLFPMSEMGLKFNKIVIFFSFSREHLGIPEMPFDSIDVYFRHTLQLNSEPWNIYWLRNLCWRWKNTHLLHCKTFLIVQHKNTEFLQKKMPIFFITKPFKVSSIISFSSLWRRVWEWNNAMNHQWFTVFREIIWNDAFNVTHMAKSYRFHANNMISKYFLSHDK